MLIRCKCGRLTNLGLTCSHCFESFLFERDPANLEELPDEDELSKEMLEELERIRKEKKKGNKKAN